MKRRVFIKYLTLLLPIIPWANNSNEKNSRVKLTTLKVAGLQYGEMNNASFVSEEKLELKREADNAYDIYAVAIYCKKRKRRTKNHSNFA